MNPKLILCLTLTLSGHLYADEPITNGGPQKLTIWTYINFPFPKNLSNDPIFMVSSQEQYDQVWPGLRLDVQYIIEGYEFIETNGVSAHLYRANGDIVEPTADGRKFLKLPVAAGDASSPEGLVPGVTTFFPWATNALGESCIEVTIGTKPYWLEMLYGFDRNPADPPPSSIHAGRPKFVAAMKSMTAHDQVVRWQNVEYDLARTIHLEISLRQANSFDAESEGVFCSDASARRLDSPKTAVRILDADGAAMNGTCIDLHLNDNHWRTDTFNFGRFGDDLRCCGQIEVRIDDKHYGVTVPSSLYKYTHGHAPN